MFVDKAVTLKITDICNFTGVKGEFCIESSSLNVLIGANGSGKSTLLKTILGIQNQGSAEIKIVTDKEQILSKTDITSLISYVPQFLSVDDSILVKDFINLGSKRSIFNIFNKGDTVQKQQLFDEVVAILEIKNLLSKDIQYLSGGELALVNLARALMQDTPFIFIDEGDASLDLGKKLKYYNILNKLVTENKKGIVLISHNLQNLFLKVKKIKLWAINENKELFQLQQKDLTSEVFSRIYASDIALKIIDDCLIIE